ncbi:hypothetical protein K2173_008956 [Erythroxylum novogranatense]|uniref:pectinesterase n=1 Tax=Erythroxylum novogranatense TaxID=1862640 RepID=A0AAV8TVC6_9ROSI|nr:hypothetical protein K2173_008956 [Erythroxylum novogranatense]
MMPSFLFIGILLGLYSSPNEALTCRLTPSNPYLVAHTITVDKSGKGKFSSVQSAIDSIPVENAEWIRIQIPPGTYNEHISIPPSKPCIFLDGAGRSSTIIQWEDNQATTTFYSYADNLVVKGITVKNNYNVLSVRERKPAFAVDVNGDKNVFYSCGFVGVQDTLFDHMGRHYFVNCYIEGAVDFICGFGKSIYQRCTINYNGKYIPGLEGYITAQKKDSPNQSGGFVFKSCRFHGTGNAYLGRAWGPYSTVIIANSKLWGGVVPLGWNAGHFSGHEATFMFAEAGNSGPGAVTSNRVRWSQKLNPVQLKRYTDISFINFDGWLAKIPKVF